MKKSSCIEVWENDPTSRLIYYLRENIFCRFMVSISSFKSRRPNLRLQNSSIQTYRWHHVDFLYKVYKGDTSQVNMWALIYYKLLCQFTWCRLRCLCGKSLPPLPESPLNTEQSHLMETTWGSPFPSPPFQIFPHAHPAQSLCLLSILLTCWSHSQCFQTDP